MAVIDIKDTTIRLRDGSTPTKQQIAIKIGEGNLTHTETKNREYIKDRGLMDSVRDGDEEPMEVSLDFMWEEIAASLGAVITVEDALKNRNGAAGWLTSGDDLCEPFAVDIEVELDAACGDVKDREYITFPQFRYQQLQHDLRAGQVSVSGSCKVVEPIIEHAHAAAIAAYFDAANSEYLSVADAANLSVNGAVFTWAGWIRPDSIVGTKGIAGKWDTGSQTEWVLRMVADKLEVHTYDSVADALDVNYLASSISLEAEKWYFVAIVYNGALVGNARLKLYINDVEDTAATYTGTIPATLPDSTAAYQEGAYDDPATAFYTGRIAVTAFWKRVLTTDEMTFLYHGGLGRVYADLTAAYKVSLSSWWEHDEQSGQRKDSQSTNHLTDNATVTYADGIRVLKS